MQVLIFVIGCYFFSISIFGWIIKKEDKSTHYPAKTKFAVVVPAHNEETVIGHIIDSLFRQNYPRELYDVFVVADNCTDKTAEIAERQGAKVFIRENKMKEGKVMLWNGCLTKFLICRKNMMQWLYLMLIIWCLQTFFMR